MVVFSGVQPSGSLHIGNYLGAIKQFAELQKDHDAIFCIVDQHAITIPQEPTKLRKFTKDLAIIYLAAGIDPTKTIIFVQSHVPAHTELAWILSTITPLGELERMTQFKEKARIKFEDIKTLKASLKRLEKDIQTISISGVQNTLKIISNDAAPIIGTFEKRKETDTGLLNYPILMAADILLYQTDIVPVGEDQTQHVEFARLLAERFNKRFGKTFKIPEMRLRKNVARIMSLTDPTKKMSKSDESQRSYILIKEDTDDKIREKIRSAVTDSGNEIVYDQVNKPAISNLLAIFSEFSGKSINELEKMYAGIDYARFKNDLAEVIIGELTPFRKKIHELQQDEKSLLTILREGAGKAAAIAEKTIKDVKQKIGFLAA